MVGRVPVVFASIVVGLALMAAAVPGVGADPDPGPTTTADSTRWDGSRWDGSRWDGSRWDGSRWDGSRWDASRWDASRWDGSRWDASRWDASRWDASRWDSHKFLDYDPLYPYQWGLRAINVPGAWAAAGQGDGSRVVCVLDSGIDSTHPDLAPRMWTDPESGTHGHDFVDDDDDPMDVGGHGTHVASIIGALAADGAGMAGIANARLMAVRVIGPDGSGTTEDLIRGIDYCVRKGAHVLSMSLSVDEKDKDLKDAVKRAEKAGLLVIASAGNDPCDDCETPITDFHSVLGVTAVSPDADVADFAPWTRKTDVAAPGVRIPGALPGGGYGLASGSSQAVPQVTGAALLVWAADPTLDAKDVAKILKKTSTKVESASGKKIRILDAEAAVLEALRKAN